MAVIKKKCWSEYFQLVSSGKKKFELRLNDFEINEGDTIILEEFDHINNKLTGRTLEKKVTNVQKFKIDELFWSTEEIMEKGLQFISLE